MSSISKTVVLDESRHAVVLIDAAKPHTMEIIEIFFDAARARDYADRENRRSAEPQLEPAKAPTQGHAEPAAATAATAALSPRQSEALHAKMDEHKQVTATARALAAAAQIPLGSLHSVLQSLEKKQLIKTVRAGSARAPAVYQVL